MNPLTDKNKLSPAQLLTGPKALNLTNYLKQKSSAPSSSATSPKQQFIQNNAPSDATPQNNTASLLGDISKRLSTLQSEQTSPKDTFVKNNTNQTSRSTPDYYAPYKSAMDDYIASLKPSQEYLDTQKSLDNLRTSTMSGISRQEESAIPMSFITGRQRAIENRGLAAMQPLEQQLSRMLAEREATSGALSERAKFEKALADQMIEQDRYEDERNQPLSLGGALVRLNPETGQYEEVYRPTETPEGFSLSEGQARYDADGNLIAQRGKTYAPTSGSSSSSGYTPGSNPAVDSWVSLIGSGRANISNVPANLKNAVASALGQSGGTKSEASTKLSQLASELLGRKTSSIVGPVQQFTGGLWGDDAYTKNLYDQLKGMLALDKRQMLKGSGSISDYEAKVLERAASALGRNLSDADFRKVLTDMVLELEQAPASVSGGSSSGGNNDPLGIRKRYGNNL